MEPHPARALSIYSTTSSSLCFTQPSTYKHLYQEQPSNPSFPDTEHLDLDPSSATMKINGFAILGFFSLLSGGFARPGNRFRACGSFFWKRQPGSLSLTDKYARSGTSSLTKARIDDNDPIDQKSRVTAFINTDEGLKVECWEIGDLLPEDQVTPAHGLKGIFRRTNIAGNIAITLFSFSPSVTIFSFDVTGVHENAIDFRAKPK